MSTNRAARVAYAHCGWPIAKPRTSGVMVKRAALIPVEMLRLDLSTRVISSKKVLPTATAIDGLGKLFKVSSTAQLMYRSGEAHPLESRGFSDEVTAAGGLRPRGAEGASVDHLARLFIHPIARRPIWE